jgi:hypothetical protein
MTPPESGTRWPGRLLPFLDLVRNSRALTFGSRTAGYALVLGAGLAWLGAALRFWRGRRRESASDWRILFGAALVPALWVLLLPGHTSIHAFFMVRLLVVPVSLALVALCWPLGTASRRSA